ncbi:hypothetical protein KBX03_07630 [Micromonospora sp. C72]|uniref:hypothetical protein n=1 Tax=Micromonospora sp. C72 TaxID=2824880 RepID=UPI001B358C2E|nr:hypothetical protein [Micromonospora sp. C72]MBQ1042374.1 hypothetical protein [Micromonospora sp. C72]
MAQLKVIRPTEVYVYQCDNPPCEELCEKEALAFEGTKCRWIGFEDYTNRKPAPGQTLPGWVSEGSPTKMWFCSYGCLAEWANQKACETGEQTCAA